MASDYLAIHAALIEQAGGSVLPDAAGRPRFVTKPGVVLPYAPRQFSGEFEKVLEVLRVDPQSATPTRFAEFLGRLTYLTRGPDQGRNGDAYVRKVAVEFGHSGITGLESEPVLFTGISDEILKELLSHENGEVIPARVGRLTSANTAAMAETLYVVSGHPEFQAAEMQFIDQYLAWLEAYNANHPPTGKGHPYFKEHLGRRNLGIKAISAAITMSTMHWKWLFMGRLKADGNEDELRRIAAQACLLLHERYPLSISHPRDYGYDL
jgi:hypothetical protein